jgi:hypothetical protein
MQSILPYPAGTREHSTMEAAQSIRTQYQVSEEVSQRRPRQGGRAQRSVTEAGTATLKWTCGCVYWTRCQVLVCQLPPPYWLWLSLADTA